jgi:integrase
VYRCLSAFYNWAAGRYAVPNPVPELMRPRPARHEAPHFDELQLRLLWGQCRGDRDRAMLRFLLDSGARLGETASLRAWDIRPGLVRVSGKTGDRQVVISPDTADALRRAANGGAVFPGQRGPLTPSGLYQAFRRLVARARLAGWRMGPHAMRHTFATLFLKAGGSVLALQRLLGHASLEQSARYVHLADMELLGHGLPSVAGRVLPSPLRGAA